jgi:hypothetical protein
MVETSDFLFERVHEDMLGVLDDAAVMPLLVALRALNVRVGLVAELASLFRAGLSVRVHVALLVDYVAFSVVPNESSIETHLRDIAAQTAVHLIRLKRFVWAVYE